jgi:acetyltransferase-like isoleucine patch superfamily enzyme
MGNEIKLWEHEGFLSLCASLNLCNKYTQILGRAVELVTLDKLIRNNTLSYANKIGYLSDLKIPSRAMILVPLDFDNKQSDNFIPVDDPSFVFWSLYEFKERAKNLNFPSKIANDVFIGSNTIISDFGVNLEEGVYIDANTVIHPGVTVRKKSRVGPGCVLGSSGFEVKRTIFGKIVITHKAGLLVDTNVEIGANCTINQGIGNNPTVIYCDTKIDCGVHIAHSCTVGSGNIIAAHVTFGGSVITGDNVFVGLNATIKNGVTLPEDSFVGAGVFVAESYRVAVKLTARPPLAMLISTVA